ncbi:MAG: hypothetical protein VX512_12195 [Pseudomonadota bacterium]|nr:hypothetical protein [Pseudomonadota bacterium]
MAIKLSAAGKKSPYGILGIAARKGETGVAFGDVLGSNIYTIFGIGGATLLLVPKSIPSNLLPLDIGLALMSAVAILVHALLRGVSCPCGITQLVTYRAYASYLILNA